MTITGSQLPVIREVMDEFKETAPTHMQARWVLPELDCMVTKAEMTFKPKKINVLGDSERQTNKKVPATCWRGSNSNNTRKSNHIPWKILRTMTAKTAYST